jgi:hypothetical protein
MRMREIAPSTTVTVITSAHCWWGVVGSRRMKDGADAGPQAVLVPAPIATVEGVPGAVGRRDLPPGRARAHDPEQALEQPSVVERRAATRRLLWR